MAKNELDRNFENLKAQMIKKKDMAKKHEDEKSITKDESKPVEIHQSIDNEDMKSNQTSPKIVIKKQEKQDVPKRITYYLNNSTIKKIEKYSKTAGMGKSAFVQTLLDIALENLEIE